MGRFSNMDMNRVSVISKIENIFYFKAFRTKKSLVNGNPSQSPSQAGKRPPAPIPTKPAPK